MTTHPEQKSSETYLGNVETAKWPDPKLAELTTLRLGAVAYGLEGEKLPKSFGLAPLFLGKPEESRYDAIMTAQLRAIRGW